MKFLAICHGNLCRSPACEIIGRALFPKTTWRSAGTHAKLGRITSKKMRDALEERGYEETSVRSQPVTAELIEWADVVVFVDERHVDALIPLGVTTKTIVRLHKVLGLDKIRDPNFGTIDDCLEVIDQITTALAQVMVARFV